MAAYVIIQFDVQGGRGGSKNPKKLSTWFVDAPLHKNHAQLVDSEFSTFKFENILEIIDNQ